MTAIVVPAFNAGATIGTLIERIRQCVDDPFLIVVDDGSTDNTAEVAASRNVNLIRHTKNRGKGAALRTGFRHFLEATQLPFVVTMDADLQHDPEDARQFISAWNSRQADILIGCRSKLGSGMPLHRMLSNTITSWLVSARTGQKILDSQSGFRLISRSVLSALSLECDGYEAETELIVKAARRGFRLGFVPIITIYGSENTSMTHFKTTRDFLRILLKEY